MPPIKPEGWKHVHARWHYFRDGSSVCGKYNAQVIGGGPVRKPWPTELDAMARKRRVCEICDRGVTEGREAGGSPHSGQPGRSAAARGVQADLARGLTPKQLLFVREYQADQDHNGKQAAIRAGYAPKNAEITASKLLRLAKVQRALAELMAPKVAELDISSDRILRELSAIAFSNMAEIHDEHGHVKPILEWPEHMQRAVAGLKYSREKITSRDISDDEDVSVVVQEFLVEYKSWEKVKALELLGKYQKLWVDRTEIEGKLDITAQQKKHRDSFKHVDQVELEALAVQADAYIALFEAARKKGQPDA